MNFLKKTWVAIALTVIMVVAAIGVGQLRAPVPGLPTDTSNSASGALDTSLSTSEYDTWISDQAGVLSSSAEEQISLYNANWDYRYNSLIAVLMVDSLDGQDIESYAYDQWTQIGLGQGDALLVAAVDDELYYVATGNDFSTILTSSVTSRLDGMLSSNFGAQRFEEGVLSFFAEMNQVYIDNFGLGNAGGGGSYQVNERTMGVISLLVLLVAALTQLINHTRIGMAMRAVSRDFETAQLMGIRINSVISVTFIIGSLLAAIGSLLYFTNYQSIVPLSGSLPGLRAFVAAVFGGIGSIPGSTPAWPPWASA